MELAERLKLMAAKAGPSLALPLPADPNRELHIDGDYAAYYYAGKDDLSLDVAKINMLNAFARAKEWAGAGGRIVIHLTCGGSHKGHRYRLATVQDYQANRLNAVKPRNWNGLRAFLETNIAVLTGYTVKIWKDREADDGCCVAAYYALHKHGTPAALFYRDKDFQMIPGLHVKWTTLERIDVKPDTWAILGEPDDKGRQKIYGRAWFWIQMLAGDTADHIPGLPKVPAKTPGKQVLCGLGRATEFVMNCHCNDMAFYKVAGLYKTYYKGAWAVHFAEQAALLWMRTDAAASINDWLQAIPYGSRREFDAACKELEARK